MYRRLPEAAGADPAAGVRITIDGEPFVARAGDSVAATLLAAGRSAFRTTPVTGAPRGPFCMMGACFDCLVVIDGRANQQSCLIQVADGMRVERQRGARVLDAPGTEAAAPTAKAGAATGHPR
jgi:predicted molibdopterin-dependent oxidoreductase YjgC